MKVHMILQGKGGVGKSVIASMLSQYLIAKGKTPLCIDTDPINDTFAGYAALNVKRVELMDGDVINTRRFDDMMELILNSDQDDAIIDNGASSFVPLSHYVLSNEVPQFLHDSGHELIIHTVITGGQAFIDTVQGFDNLVKYYADKNCRIVVWLNPYWGPVSSDGKAFEEMKVYTGNKKNIAAIIRLPILKDETHGQDFAEVLKAKLTFDQAQVTPEFQIMMKQRLKLVQRQIYDQIEVSAQV